MKILLVHNSYQQHGGEDTVVEQERQLLERAGHGVAVYQRSNHEIQDCSAVGRLQLPGRAVWATDSRRQIAELISRHRPDVIHVHNTFVVVSPSIYSACQEAQSQSYRHCITIAFFVRPRLSFAMERSVKNASTTACGGGSGTVVIVTAAWRQPRWP